MVREGEGGGNGWFEKGGGGLNFQIEFIIKLLSGGTPKSHRAF